MSFPEGIRRQTDALRAKLDQAARVAVAEVFNSVTVGSTVTGSLGTPVDTGFARASWTLNGSRDGAAVAQTIRAGDVVTIRGGAVYLPVLEEGRRVVNGRTITIRLRPPYQIGWVRLTKAQWPAIMRHALRTVGLGT